MAKRIDHLLQESVANLSLPPVAAHGAWTPNTDVYETPEAVVVKLEIAGIERDDLEISLNDRLLVVRGYRRDECRQQRCLFRQMEIDYGYFERRIVIPMAVDGDRVRAQFQGGFLHIELPKGGKTGSAVIAIIIESGQ